MSSAVLALSLLAAIDPVRIGITALLISRPRPMLNLVSVAMKKSPLVAKWRSPLVAR